jgi:hypothetical protein
MSPKIDLAIWLLGMVALLIERWRRYRPMITWIDFITSMIVPMSYGWILPKIINALCDKG